MSCIPPCTTNISPQSLNTLLIPTFLQGMSTSQQDAFINATTSVATTFRNQVIKFIGDIAYAKKQLANRRTVCNIKIAWSVSNPPLWLNQTVQANYYDFMIVNTTGFAYIAGRVLNYFRNQKKCSINRSNGFSYCVAT